MTKKRAGNWKFLDANGEQQILKRIDVGIAKRVLKVVDKGLKDGMGKPEPGSMCVEAAVCYAIGQRHGDDPVCVHPTVRGNKIDMNDSLPWGNDKARARGLRRMSIAQLGTTSMNIMKYKAAYSANVSALAAAIVEEHMPENELDTRALEKIVGDLKKGGDYYTIRDLCDRISEEATNVANKCNVSLEGARNDFLAYNASDSLGDFIDAAENFLSEAKVKKMRVILDRLSFQIAEAGVQALIAAKAQGAKFLHLAKKVPLK